MYSVDWKLNYFEICFKQIIKEMKNQLDHIPFPKLLIDHFYIGVIVTLFYIGVSPFVIAMGYPGIAVLLLAELIIIAPLAIVHFLAVGKKINHRFSLKNVIQFTDKIPLKSFVLWTIGGLLAILLIYVPLYPLGLMIRESVFHWLPEWYFNPTFGTDDLNLIAITFLAGIFIDGIVGPVAEELFFRGYLLPRMSYLKNWAPIVNGTLFGLYHFWQPHNMIAIIGVGIILSYVVWKKRNVYLGIAIHCTLNIIGALGAYLAVLDGTILVR